MILCIKASPRNPTDTERDENCVDTNRAIYREIVVAQDDKCLYLSFRGTRRVISRTGCVTETTR